MTSDRILHRYGVSAEAEAMWRLLLSTPNATEADLLALSRTSADGLSRCMKPLLDAHLIRRDGQAPSGYVANDPGVALEVFAIRDERRLAAETERVVDFRAQIPELADLYEAGRARAGILPGFEILTSVDDIRRQIYLEGEGARELRSLLYKMSPQASIHSRDVDRKSLQRGVKMRSIVRPSDLDSPGLYDAIRWLHHEGEEIRSNESVPTQMQIMDRRTAVIRVDPDDPTKGAMFVRVLNLVELLIDLYERLWEDAEPLFPATLIDPALTVRQLEVLTLVAAGTKDEAIARSLSVGVRTIRRDLSELKELAGASSRTDLITAAMRRGWIPTPTSAAPSPGVAETANDQAV